MKISTVRSLLILFDLVLVGGIVGVVYLGVQQQKERRADRRSYQQDALKRLAEVKVNEVKTQTKKSYSAIGRLNYAGKAPPEPKKIDKGPKPVPKNVWRPLEDLIILIGAEVHGENVEQPSFILYSRTGDTPITTRPATTPRRTPARPGNRDPRGAARGGRGNPRNGGRPRTVPTPGNSGPSRTIYNAVIGEVIEFSDHELALVKNIKPVLDPELGQTIGWRVVFGYGGKDVEIDVVGETPAKGAVKVVTDNTPISNDPGTWLSWDSKTPHEIRVTDMGLRAFKQKGEKALEGVRFATERIPGKNQKAVKVTHIPDGSLLQKGGVQSGDVFESINDTPVSSRSDIVRYVKQNPNLGSYKVTFWRDGARRSRTVIPPKR